MKNARQQNGSSAPLGATVTADGVNFSVFSKNATAVELLLFDEVLAASPSRVVKLEPPRHRTYHYWHVFVPGLQPGQVYGYRAHGPFAPERGLRFDGRKLLLDPYGLAVGVPPSYDRDAATRPGDNCAAALKSVVAAPAAYDWEGDRPLHTTPARTVIYEMHVRGFTQHPSSGVPAGLHGTYAGVIAKIPYLQDLGVTAVELLPVFQFDAADAPVGRTNYWGYQPVSFFAPHQQYSSRRDPLGALDEFRDMVKALHRASIEVILDVVFNHTAEGNHEGPTLCYRGLANDFYYMLDTDKSRYANFTGCGNTLNPNQPIVRRMIQDSLRYWVTQMHVDGFRFDLASILSRDEAGQPVKNPPVLWDIESDPVLAGTKLIAEAWDAAGLYQVGSFVGDTWQEWNGRFRDDVRRFWRGDDCTVSAFATRLLGSPDLYQHKQREPEQSVNFITCHDGFTLSDLVSYNQKHNEANGEDNRDGSDDNFSWNCGVEGATDDPQLEALRARQMKNFLTVLLMAAGTPMLLMGDEVRRSQGGNNNAYSLDNEANWFDWTLVDRHRGLHRFVRRLLSFRLRRDLVDDRTPLTLHQVLQSAHIEWHGVTLGRPDWSDHSHSLAFTAQVPHWSFVLHGMFNAYSQPLTFELPQRSGSPNRWQRCVDTALEPPNDFCLPQAGLPVIDGAYRAEPHSCVVLVSQLWSNDDEEIDWVGGNRASGVARPPRNGAGAEDVL
jgi:glycogen operon protein